MRNGTQSSTANAIEVQSRRMADARQLNQSPRWRRADKEIASVAPDPNSRGHDRAE
jgi:hypothetical protein